MSSTPLFKLFEIPPWGLSMKMLRAGLKFQIAREEEIERTDIW